MQLESLESCLEKPFHLRLTDQNEIRIYSNNCCNLGTGFNWRETQQMMNASTVLTLIPCFTEATIHTGHESIICASLLTAQYRERGCTMDAVIVTSWFSFRFSLRFRIPCSSFLLLPYWPFLLSSSVLPLSLSIHISIYLSSRNSPV